MAKDEKVEIVGFDRATRRAKDEKPQKVPLEEAKKMVYDNKARFALKRVYFTMGHGCYNAGETAGFNSVETKKLLDMKVAVLVDKDGKPEFPPVPEDPGEPTASKAVVEKIEAAEGEPTASKKAAKRRGRRSK